MRQRAEVLDHLTEIAAVDPTTARGTFDEVLGFTLKADRQRADRYISRANVNYGQPGRAWDRDRERSARGRTHPSLEWELCTG